MHLHLVPFIHSCYFVNIYLSILFMIVMHSIYYYFFVFFSNIVACLKTYLCFMFVAMFLFYVEKGWPRLVTTSHEETVSFKSKIYETSEHPRSWGNATLSQGMINSVEIVMSTSRP
uniref:Uncharacterized protein n=1 Tax=Cacopsylla melanoneura TaxID=428564 RepID=A0A8D8SVY7_9HEMI